MAMKFNPMRNRICENCGKKFITNPAYVKRRKRAGVFCTRKCFVSFQRKFPKRRIDESGYVAVKGSREHRLVMEHYLGRKLMPIEHVHHKDGDKTNNHISNLEILSNSEHWKHHAEERPCIKCLDCKKRIKQVVPNLKRCPNCKRLEKNRLEVIRRIRIKLHAEEMFIMLRGPEA